MESLETLRNPPLRNWAVAICGTGTQVDFFVYNQRGIVATGNVPLSFDIYDFGVARMTPSGLVVDYTGVSYEGEEGAVSTDRLVWDSARGEVVVQGDGILELETYAGAQEPAILPAATGEANDAHVAALDSPPAACVTHTDPMSCWGELLSREMGCVGCHTADGSPGIAPTWRGLYGSRRSFTDGTAREADTDYIIQSLVEPQSQVVAGFTRASMPPYAPTENRRLALVAFIRSLATEGQAQGAADGSPAVAALTEVRFESGSGLCVAQLTGDTVVGHCELASLGRTDLERCRSIPLEHAVAQRTPTSIERVVACPSSDGSEGPPLVFLIESGYGVHAVLTHDPTAGLVSVRVPNGPSGQSRRLEVRLAYADTMGEGREEIAVDAAMSWERGRGPLVEGDQLRLLWSSTF
ncbi:MAG: hypothetical protein H6726_19190 [Sandaracinaceae bacterium]|nr:hypothetical protein [Sandaracinaceae bacterium]